MRAAHHTLIRLDGYLMIRSYFLISLSGTYMITSFYIVFPEGWKYLCFIFLPLI